MKQLNVLLFAFLVSIAACKKETAEPKINTPVAIGEYWKSSFMTIDPLIHDQHLHLCRVAMYITPEYFIRDNAYESGYATHDSTACTIVNDSIYFTKNGVNYSGKHYVLNDTLYTAIPPYKYYK